MKEYIEFSDKVFINDIISYIEKLSFQYKLSSNKNLVINGVSNGLFKVDGTLCFIENIKDIEDINEIPNSLILTNSQRSDDFNLFNILYVDDARYLFIKLLELFNEKDLLNSFTSSLNCKKSFISSKANIHPSVILEDNVVVEDNVTISAGSVIKNGTYISANTIIRENCTIGCDGIALYKAKNGKVMRFPHIAGIYIGKNVEIGANSVIVSGTLSNTIIDDDTVIGNLCNIGHGVRIGKKVWLSVGGLIGGNCIIENHVTMGLSVSLKDNLFITEGSTIGMGSVVTKSLKVKTTVFGNPAKPLRPLNVGPKR